MQTFLFYFYILFCRTRFSFTTKKLFYNFRASKNYLPKHFLNYNITVLYNFLLFVCLGLLGNIIQCKPTLNNNRGMILIYTHEPPINCKPLCLHFFKSSMKPEKNFINMHCLPVLNNTESFKGLANREVGLKQIEKFVPNRQEVNNSN